MKKTLAFVLAGMLFAGHSSAEEKIDWGEETVKILEGIANIVDRDRTNCDKMANELNPFFDQRAALVAQLKKLAPTHTKAELEAFAAKYRDRIEASNV